MPLTADIICLPPPRRCRDAIRHIYGFRHVEQTPTNHQLQQALSQSKHCATNQMPDDRLFNGNQSAYIDVYRTSLPRKVNTISRSFTSNMHFEARSVDFANPSAAPAVIIPKSIWLFLSEQPQPIRRRRRREFLRSEQAGGRCQ